jgi:hypothetical protein
VRAQLSRIRRSTDIFVAGALCALGSIVLIGQRQDAFIASRDHSAIQYTAAAADTVVGQLSHRLAAGAVALDFDPVHGYLSSLLLALDIPTESQQLVFSETSGQASQISPTNPRAIFFNDSIAVGWVRGAPTLEIAAHHARQGTIFYTLEQQRASRPRLVRQERCLLCHLSWETRGVPGWMVLSTFPMSDDKNAYATGVTVDHRTELHQRWGGWYVTGTQVPDRHFGNLPVIRPERTLKSPPPTPVYASLAGVFDRAGYPSSYSDVAAAMVLSHQAHGLNLITRLGWEARLAEFEKAAPGKVVADRVALAANELADYLSFVDEPLLVRPLEGSSGFEQRFASSGPHDRRGRSLRDISLEHHLFRHPCSYLIYSPAFDALPPSVQNVVYQRVWAILSGRLTGSASSWTREDRTAAIEILRDTKPGLPSYFRDTIR